MFKDYGYGATTFSPLASGLLTGKYNDGFPAGTRATLKGYELVHHHFTNAEAIARVKALQAIAAELGCTSAQMALAWCLKNPNVSSVITGASRVEQVHENMKALEVVAKLTPGRIQKIERQPCKNNPN